MRRRRLIVIPLGLAIVVLLAWVRLADPYPVQALREIAFDGFQRVAPRAEGDFPIRIVDIDEASLETVGQWPWPRDRMAELTRRLTELGAAAIVYDVLFPEADRLSPVRIAEAMGLEPGEEPLADFDADFAAALAAGPSVLGFGLTPGAGAIEQRPKAGFAVNGATTEVNVPIMPGAVMPIPLLAEAAQGLGSVSLEPAGNVSVVRRLPLIWADGSRLYPSLAIEALRVAVGARTVLVLSDLTGGRTVDAIRLANFEVPTTPDGGLWLYYQPTPDDLYVPAAEILGPDYQAQQELIAGNIVFIGTSATGLLDIRGTPLGTNMPGVEIHVQALQQILSGTFLQRADWISGAEILAFVLISIAIIFVTLFSGPLIGLAVGGGLLIAMGAASWLAFANAGVLVDPSFPVLGAFIVYAAMVFFQFTIADADKRKIRGAFGYYVAPALLTEIEKNSGRLRLGGETRELSIMFSDVRNFTTLSEGLTPERLVAKINTLFNALGNEITGQYGTIDKFIGDAIMAFWNAPVDVERHALRACKAALGMRHRLRELNAADGFGLRAENHPMGELAIGIGIATGEALVGNFGLETRFDYSCVGDSVNVASRVEGACKTVGYDIVVVETTRREATGLAFLEAGAIALKGKSRPEPIHILVGDEALAASADFKALEAAHQAAIEALAADDPNADAAIDRCLALITFPDALMATFYEVMRGRGGDFGGRSAKPAMAEAH
ncbi:MAG: adenylate/guanylate cyclase domain-containing protein [Bauldia sp.]|nr:adenylate/guanylate cyclase domain-containing protein [Bauldia sp.]